MSWPSISAATTQSGQPDGVENYKTDKLVGDVVAVVKHFGPGKAVIVGHDWGGLVAWTFAMTHPELTDRLIVLNLPHPRGLLRELATNPEQQKNSQYARNFQKPDAAKHVPLEFLTGWVKDPEARKVYLAAFKRSSLEGMLNYYKANYPRLPDDAAKNSGAKAGDARFSSRQVLGALDPRPEGSGPAPRRTQRHVEMDRRRPDARDNPRRRPFRSTGRRRICYQNDGWLALEIDPSLNGLPQVRECEAPAEPRSTAFRKSGSARLLPSRAQRPSANPGVRGSCRAALNGLPQIRECEAPAEPRSTAFRKSGSARLLPSRSRVGLRSDALHHRIAQGRFRASSPAIASPADTVRLRLPVVQSPYKTPRRPIRRSRPGLRSFA